MLFLFPAGIFLSFRKFNEVNIIFILYGLLAFVVASISTYFSAALFPIVSILASLGLTSTFRTYLRNQDAVPKKVVGKPISKEINLAMLTGIGVIVLFFVANSFSATAHPTMYQTSTVFPAVSMQTHDVKWIDDLREATAWLRENTQNDTKIITWRGLGQQIASVARQSVLGSNTDNPLNIGTVGKFFLAEETAAVEIAKQLGAEYALIIFGGASGYFNDDITEAYNVAFDSHFTEHSTLFKFAYKGFSDVPTRPAEHPGFDLVRQNTISSRVPLSHFDESFTSDNWLIRIYKLRPTAIIIEEENNDDNILNEHLQQ